MTSITFAIPDETKSKMKLFPWVNWSELVRQAILLNLLKKLKSSEEQELTMWSVELGRKAKKGRFQKLLSELSLKEREKFFKK